MPGYNHRPECPCGWCVNFGGTRLNRQQVRDDLRRRDAVALLKRNSAHSVAACFVNPNARCPECGAPVFFYSNEFGSKVFFDDLGPPWPKHPCTDNPRRKIDLHSVVGGALVRRSRGLTQELVAAGRTAGIFSLGRKGAEDGNWRLLFVAAVKQTGVENVVSAECVEAATQEAFTYRSSTPLLTAGDFVSRKDEMISFLHKETLETLTIKDGAEVQPATVEKAIEDRVRANPAEPRSDRVARVPDSRPPSTYDMAPAEMVHFHSDRIDVAALCRKLEPLVKSYARSGTRKPRDVAARLNAEGHKTAAGSRWTPRLTHFLLGLIFLDSEKRQARSSKKMRQATAPRHRSAAEAQGGMSPLTQADMARRLAALGRVILKAK